MSSTYQRSGGLVQRRAATVSSNDNTKDDIDEKLNGDGLEDQDSKETRLTLMEEVLLLGLKDREVRTKSGLESC